MGRGRARARRLPLSGQWATGRFQVRTNTLPPCLVARSHTRRPFSSTHTAQTLSATPLRSTPPSSLALRTLYHHHAVSRDRGGTQKWRDVPARSPPVCGVSFCPAWPALQRGPPALCRLAGWRLAVETHEWAAVLCPAFVLPLGASFFSPSFSVSFSCAKNVSSLARSCPACPHALSLSSFSSLSISLSPSRTCLGCVRLPPFLSGAPLCFRFPSLSAPPGPSTARTYTHSHTHAHTHTHTRVASHIGALLFSPSLPSTLCWPLLGNVLPLASSP